MKNKKNVIGIILLIIVLLTFILLFKSKNFKKENSNNENISEPIKTVEEIKKETGATAEEDIYEVQQEYDGREVLAIKPNIQFSTVLAGILKNGEPTIEETEKIDLSNFSKKGIWISETSRNRFLDILKKCGVSNFDIDNEGYLYKKDDVTENKYALKLEKLINSEELIIIDISGTCFMRDEMTGEIVEYPFKDMDLYQVCEKFSIEGYEIIIFTTNNVEESSFLEEL